MYIRFKNILVLPRCTSVSCYSTTHQYSIIYFSCLGHIIINISVQFCSQAIKTKLLLSQSTPIYSLIPCLFDWGVTRGIRLGAGGPVERRIPIVFIYPVAQLELHCFFISWSDADTMPEFRARIFPTRSATLNLSDSVCTETFVPYTSFFRYSPNSSVFATFLAGLFAWSDKFVFRFILPAWFWTAVVVVHVNPNFDDAQGFTAEQHLSIIFYHTTIKWNKITPLDLRFIIGITIVKDHTWTRTTF